MARPQTAPESSRRIQSGRTNRPYSRGYSGRSGSSGIMALSSPVSSPVGRFRDLSQGHTPFAEKRPETLSPHPNTPPHKDLPVFVHAMDSNRSERAKQKKRKQLKGKRYRTRERMRSTSGALSSATKM